MSTHRLEPHSGMLKGLALIVSIDGNAQEIITLDIKPVQLIQASDVELSIVPIVEPLKLSPVPADGSIRERLERG